MLVPTAYRPGLERAARMNPKLAHRYVRHATMGDPLADAAVASLAGYRDAAIHRLLDAGMEQDEARLAEAPAALREFFERTSAPPLWLDRRALNAGCGAFQADPDLFILGLLAGGLVRGFSTLISLSFFTTGRLIDHAVRRLKHNIRQLVEVTFPGGLERQADGWKYTVRIRFVHAQVRRLIRESGEWDESVYGVPLSSAHLALASGVFSAMLLDDVERLGARLTPEGRAGYMHIWRYTAVLLGVPDAILFRDEASALDICRIGAACEPEPGESAIVMANSLLNVAPVVIGLSEPGERAALADYGLRVSRALVGHELADKLRFPRQHTAGMLFGMRLQRRMGGLFDRLLGRTYVTRANRFAELVEHATLEDTGISYRLPLKLYSDEAQTW
ncbi:MAG: oxygenase MpaB family protein [Acidobacteriota bacterium]|nr:oxygenase MpaB family protein [Acidobacteriota bacterium]